MDTCHALFVLEGSTDVTLIRTCLRAAHGAEEIGPLHVRLTPGDERPVQRRKVRIGPSIVGLFDAFGKDNAVKSYRQLVNLWRRGLFPQLRLLVLVVDLDSRKPASLHSGFLQRMEQLAQAEELPFAVQQRQPAWAELGRLKVTQVLVGDPSSDSGPPHAAEDHILQFLRGAARARSNEPLQAGCRGAWRTLDTQTTGATEYGPRRLLEPGQRLL